MEAAGYLRAVRLLRDQVTAFDAYPFSIPAVRSLDELALDPKVTFLIGDNGSGKSTLIEAIAVQMYFIGSGSWASQLGCANSMCTCCTQPPYGDSH